MKKLHKSRKAQFFFFFIALLTIISMISILFFIGLKRESFSEPAGLKAFETVGMQQEAEKSLMFIDYSAKIAAWHSAYQLADSGAVFDSEKYHGYSLWNKFPENYKQLYLQKTKFNLRNLISKIIEKQTNTSELTKVLITLLDSQDNIVKYDLITKNQRLIGSASHPLEAIGYRKKLDAFAATRTYHVFPSFNVFTGYDINEYSEIISQADDLLNKCSSSNNTYECIIKNKSPGWIVGDCNANIVDKNSEKFRFCIISNYNIPVFEDYLQIKPLKYKLALDFKKIDSIT